MVFSRTGWNTVQLLLSMTTGWVAVFEIYPALWRAESSPCITFIIIKWLWSDINPYCKCRSSKSQHRFINTIPTKTVSRVHLESSLSTCQLHNRLGTCCSVGELQRSSPGASNSFATKEKQTHKGQCWCCCCCSYVMKDGSQSLIRRRRTHFADIG